MSKPQIVIRGAAEHNLKNIDITLPKHKMIVVTGKSGSGKSSLAFDTIYREGQRRYMESLSSYARQFMDQSTKPQVEHIEGLSPTIAIEQRKSNANPRSTVATVTEIYDYLRVMFARTGQPHCPSCDKPMGRQTVQQIVDTILEFPEGARLYVLAPVIRGKKGEHAEVFASAKREGFTRVRVDGKIYDVGEEPKLTKTKRHSIDILVDRVKVRNDVKGRLTESIELALKIGNGLVIAGVESKAGAFDDHLFSEHFGCPDCDVSLEELEPRMFSFNSPYGACEACSGLGNLMELDPDKIVPNDSVSLRNGAVQAWRQEGKRMMIYYSYMLKDFASAFKVDLDAPYSDMSAKQRKALLYGSGDFEGVVPNLQRRFETSDSEYVKHRIHQYMSKHPCPSCNGNRLRDESLAVRIGKFNIIDVTKLSIDDALTYFKTLKFSKEKAIIAAELSKEITQRLEFMQDVGLGYLNLSRSSDTLSGGEAQRIRLATQVGSKLTGVIYVLDEPTIGLHSRDNHRLIATLSRLRDLGNTLVIVEHDRDVIEAADYIVDIGPGSGSQGGNVMATGTVAQIRKSKQSITGPYLKQPQLLPTPETRRAINKKRLLQLKGACANNLQRVNVDFPLGLLSCITGVSGSGKSTLVNQTLAKILHGHFYKSPNKPGSFKSIKGLDNIDKVIIIDQTPIGKTSRSNPATYVGVFDDIRKLFSQVPEARMRGYKPGRFSFNVKGGRCESCQGLGRRKIEMHFLPDVHVECPDCKGKRFNRETREIKYKGLTIDEVLNTEIKQAINIFENFRPIADKIQLLIDVGLDYLTLGQSSTTLSGGEAQRIKLANELGKRDTGNTVYILDEPTTGLHFAEIEKLMRILNRLVDKGNTVIVIEHNLDVIKCADHVIDMGPEGGVGGGTVVALGTPEDVAKNKASLTGKFLKEAL